MPAELKESEVQPIPAELKHRSVHPLPGDLKLISAHPIPAELTTMAIPIFLYRVLLGVQAETILLKLLKMILSPRWHIFVNDLLKPLNELKKTLDERVHVRRQIHDHLIVHEIHQGIHNCQSPEAHKTFHDRNHQARSRKRLFIEI